MRHVYIRGLMALIWLIVAIVSVCTGNFIVAAFDAVMGGVFLYSAHSARRRERDGEDDRGQR